MSEYISNPDLDVGKTLQKRNKAKYFFIFLFFPILILLLFVAVNTIILAGTGSGAISEGSSIPAIRTILNYFLGFLGILVLPLFIPSLILGFRYRNMKIYLPGHSDERSGKASLSQIPEEIRGWSWGAAGLGMIWGLYHGVWISLLGLIPYFNLIWWIFMGIYGNEWAWRKNQWKSIEAFQMAQDKWKIWGIVVFSFFAVLIFIGMIMGIVDSI